MISFQNNLLSLLFFNVINKTPDSRRSTAAAGGMTFFLSAISTSWGGREEAELRVGHTAASQVVSTNTSVVDWLQHHTFPHAFVRACVSYVSCISSYNLMIGTDFVFLRENKTFKHLKKNFNTTRTPRGGRCSSDRAS